MWSCFSLVFLCFKVKHYFQMAQAAISEDRLTSGHRLSHPPPGDEVLISGISGYFPDSDSVIHLQENLFNKVGFQEAKSFKNITLNNIIFKLVLITFFKYNSLYMKWTTNINLMKYKRNDFFREIPINFQFSEFFTSTVSKDSKIDAQTLVTFVCVELEAFIFLFYKWP